MKYINTYADLATYSASTGSFSFPHVAFAVQEEQVKYDKDPGALGFNIWGTATGDTAPTLFINGLTYGASFDGSYWKFGTDKNITRFRINSGKANIISIDKLENSTSDGIIHYDNQYGNFGGLFENMTNLEYVDVSKIDTSAVTTFYELFSDCHKLVEINGVENLNTSGVTTMYYTFSGCWELPSLDLSNWVTSGVTNMVWMFQACAKMTTLNLSNWDMSNVTQMSVMFGSCSMLTSIIANNTNQTTLEKIQGQLVSDNVASHVTITRDGFNWNYSGGQWVSTPV